MKTRRAAVFVLVLVPLTVWMGVRAGQTPLELRVRLSPDPVCLRVGSTMNLAVTLPVPFNFTYLPAGMFRWEEDAAEPLGVFTAKGEFTALREGTTRIAIEPDSSMPARSRLRKIVDVHISPARTFPSAPDKEVVAIYFPWFSERYTPIPPRPRAADQWSLLTPTVTPYDPQAEAVTKQHIRMARDAGIDAFCISWFTNRVKFDWDYDTLFAPLLANFARLAPRLGFKAYIHYESHMNLLVSDGNFTPLRTEAERARARSSAIADFDYLLNILTPVEDHPVIFAYLAEYVGLTPQDWKLVIDETRKKYPAALFYGGTFNLDYLQAFDGLYDFSAGYFQSTLDAYTPMAAAVKDYGADKKFYATVSPGFDPRIFWGPTSLLIPRGAGEYYQMTWERALAARPDGIFITTWNEWGESSVIEPAKQYGYQYIDTTADNVIRFKTR
jgi:hypothetical protein